MGHAVAFLFMEETEVVPGHTTGLNDSRPHSVQSGTPEKSRPCPDSRWLRKECKFGKDKCVLGERQIMDRYRLKAIADSGAISCTVACETSCLIWDILLKPQMKKMRSYIWNIHHYSDIELFYKARYPANRSALQTSTTAQFILILIVMTDYVGTGYCMPRCQACSCIFLNEDVVFCVM